MRVSLGDMYRMLSEASPTARAALEGLSREWAPEPAPPTIAMSAIARDLSRLKEDATGEWPAVLALIERAMIEGDESVQTAASTGFLERMLSDATAPDWKYRRMLKVLGLRSRQYCVAWDKFTKLSTPGLL